jgi:4-alpha-glucanotransferase
LDELPAVNTPDTELGGFKAVQVALPKKLPTGYYDLRIAAGSAEFNSSVISSPRKAFSRNTADAEGLEQERNNESRRAPWGCFLPLYALRTNHDWGIGDFGSLRDFAAWVGELGAAHAATLPLLAAFLDEPLEVSPYRPASRLFWNELYIDVEALADACVRHEAALRIQSPEFLGCLEAHRDSELVNYHEVMRLKRSVLERIGQAYFADQDGSRQLKRFIAENPLVVDYAQFRAVQEKQQSVWQQWPDRMKPGSLKDTDYDAAVFHYHVFVQQVANHQLARLRDAADSAHCSLYLDLPIGVHPGGFDTWRFAEQYIDGASVGAPPDIVFPKGQDWGLPPPHPERSRQRGHELFRKVMENNCRYAGRLRIDHILGFHRLYCIPPGEGANRGAFVRYPAEELYAIAIVESHRWGCELVGENLGTVPQDVNQRMRSHAIAGMWVAPYELEPGRRNCLSAPTRHDVAMLNTHDMPPLAAWWQGLDIQERVRLGLIDAKTALREQEDRITAITQLNEWLRSTGSVAIDNDGTENYPPLSALLRNLASNRARLVLINLEDLWFETRPQNVPGISSGFPNWRRKARFRLDELRNMSQVTDVLRAVHKMTRGKELRHDAAIDRYRS